MAEKNLLVGNYLFPRGGSAFVVKSLVENMPDWQIELFSGITDETLSFFPVENAHYINYTPAMKSEDPMNFDPPMQGVYRPKDTSPDIPFSLMNDLLLQKQIDSWRNLFSKSKQDPDLLYLSHLKPMHEAALATWSDVPLVTHLHGTELLFLEEESDDPYYKTFREMMLSWGERSRAFFVAPGNEERVQRFWANHEIFPIANGIYPEKTKKQDVKREEVWQDVFLKNPRALDEKGEQLIYNDINPLLEGPIFIASGRFTKVKQFPLLIEAWSEIFSRLKEASSLVLIGGYPGETEGEHPARTIKRTGARNVFLAGWHPAEDLPRLLSAADVFLMPSAREQFGNVLLEASACALPALAIESPGPKLLITEKSGLLVRNNKESLKEGLIKISKREEEWTSMGRAAREHAKKFSQEEINKEISQIFHHLTS